MVETLAEVVEAKAVMNEALDWSVVRWLREKKRVRKMADRANDALDKSIGAAKICWNAELVAAYASVEGSRKNNNGDPNISGELLKIAGEFKRAHDSARRAREEAENIFDEAERQFSTRLAREGCRKAILSWELHEKAIRKAEAASAT